jgi:hypothetical protein
MRIGVDSQRRVQSDVRFSAIRKLKRLHGRIVGYALKWLLDGEKPLGAPPG